MSIDSAEIVVFHYVPGAYGHYLHVVERFRFDAIGDFYGFVLSSGYAEWPNPLDFIFTEHANQVSWYDLVLGS